MMLFKTFTLNPLQSQMRAPNTAPPTTVSGPAYGYQQRNAPAQGYGGVIYSPTGGGYINGGGQQFQKTIGSVMPNIPYVNGRFTGGRDGMGSVGVNPFGHLTVEQFRQLDPKSLSTDDRIAYYYVGNSLKRRKV